jgi:hypothetical protein
MKNNHLIILFNKIDVPIEMDYMEFDKAFQYKKDELSCHFLQFKIKNHCQQYPSQN